MITLILVGIILLLINFTVGAIYIAAVWFAITIGLIIKEEKKKNNIKPKRTRDVNVCNKSKALCIKDPMKFWVYFTCIVISLIAVVLCVEVAQCGL